MTSVTLLSGWLLEQNLALVKKKSMCHPEGSINLKNIKEFYIFKKITCSIVHKANKLENED